MIIDELRADVANGRVVVVAGAGVALNVTHGDPLAGWPGLIKAGIAKALELGNAKDAWAENVQSDLSLGLSEDPDFLCSAAEKITKALGGRNHGEFQAWLRDTVGSLKAVTTEVVDAISSWQEPIETTNYDSLLEDITNSGTVTWRDPSGMARSLSNRDTEVIHLHGVWKDSASVVFGSQSYAEIAGTSPAQALQQAMSTLKTLVFIGCGTGLNDPNFGQLREWLRQHFGHVEQRHYRLCRDDEFAALKAEHRDDRILPMSFGQSFGDLAAYLRDLAPETPTTLTVPGAPLVRPAASEQAFEALCDGIRSRAVLADRMNGVDDRKVSQLLVPPVLLPMTQSQFYDMQNLPRGERPQRSNPHDDARSQGVLIIAADENAGLTSSLEWLISEAHLVRPAVAPLLVDFTDIGKGFTPLNKRITKLLMAAGAIHLRRDEHPPLALAIDNVSVRPSAIFDRVLTELVSARPSFIVLGCRQGNEAELGERLNSAGVDFELRYVGRMTTRDAVQLASLVEPARATALASKAMEVADREHLARTPMTLALLISVLLAGEAYLGTASETALLDAYVSLLLGLGDPHDDARRGLDSVARADILGHLAENFATANTGSLSQERVVGIISEYLDALAWSESAIDILTTFTDRRLLTIRGDTVRFTQSSFLHLFAAKRAMRSPEFLSGILERPLYYAAIIKHYAGLTRDDATVLRAIEKLVDEGTVAGSPGTGSFWEIAPPDMWKSDDSGFTDFRENEKLHGTAADSNAGRVTQESVEEWFESFRGSDPSPFPVRAAEDAPLTVQVLDIVTLVSNVLRDSELVDDLELKRRILFKTLHAWGILTELLEGDTHYGEFLERLGHRLSEGLGLPESRRIDFVETFCEMGPSLTAVGGIGMTLASRKLIRLLNELFDTSEFSDDALAATMGALLGFNIQHEGWPMLFAGVRRDHGTRPAVALTLRRLALLAYFTDSTRQADLAGLEDFLVDQHVEGRRFASHVDEKYARDQARTRLQSNRRLLHERRRAQTSQQPLTEIDGPDGLSQPELPAGDSST